MPTKVLDLEYQDLPAEITGLSGYSWALALLRYKGKPAAKITLPVHEGMLRKEELLAAIPQQTGWGFWKRWLEDFVDYEERFPPVSFAPPATIAVCTRDRPDDLKRCLDALLKLPERGQEILVVDSASASDMPRRIVESYAGIRYCREEAPGLNRARNRALSEAVHEIIAFIDDDAIPDPGWLDALLRNFSQPRVLCVTGLTMPAELETRAQECFETYNAFSRGFTWKVYDRRDIHPLAAGHVGAGVNMALRRNVLEKIGPFDERLDAGTPTRSGGDTEMFSRILAAAYQIVYEPAALNWHRHRQTWDELRLAIYGYGVGVYAFWTQKFLEGQEYSVPYFALEWFFVEQFPNLVRALFRLPGHRPLRLILAELGGCIAGPKAFLRSRTSRKAPMPVRASTQ